MELELVNENKLKITLTNEDMEALEITFEDMDYDGDANTRRVLWGILSEAKKQTGFDVTDSGVKFVVHPSKNNGCYILVTKKEQYPAYAKSYKKLYTGIKKKRLLYMFECSDNLLDACRQLMLVGYTGKSDIFADDDKYYLYIEDNREYCLGMISEYGFLVNNPFFSFYLDEHTKKIIAADAVQKFAEIFN